MRRILLIILTLTIVVTVLTACGAVARSAPAAIASVTHTPALETAGGGKLPARSDTQGAVEVTVTPLDWSSGPVTLDFDVAMNTHSVELVFDLAELATLTTDTGLTLQPVKWDAPSGGHHVEGTLSFPAQLDGKSVLEGVHQLTLAIEDVDTAERTFTWELP